MLATIYHQLPVSLVDERNLPLLSEFPKLSEDEGEGGGDEKTNSLLKAILLVKMGFPVGYTEVFVPKLFLHALSLLGFIRSLISSLFHFLGLSDFHEPEPFFPDPSLRAPDCPPVSALLIRELLPVTRFEDSADPPDSCAVCLYEFEAGEEIRRLRNCRHVFHRSCLDRWMDCDQMTCPLCRTRFVPDGMEEEFNQRLWAASGVAVIGGEGDFFCEYSTV